jgi:hypothetical protein
VSSQAASLGKREAAFSFSRSGAMSRLGEMKSSAHLKPGQDGTKRLVEKYGDALLCVRYRFDEVRGVKLKTVEIVVDEKPLRKPRFKDDDLVPVSVGYVEKGPSGVGIGKLQTLTMCNLIRPVVFDERNRC